MANVINELSVKYSHIVPVGIWSALTLYKKGAETKDSINIRTTKISVAAKYKWEEDKNSSERIGGGE